jgi:hypothetical protein
MRIVIGITLLVAAFLKAWEVIANPGVLLQWEANRILVPMQIACELSIGLAAILGIWWRQLRVVTFFLFVAFAAYSLSLALQGAQSCGCFGPIKVSPWWTFLLDLLIVAGLAAEWILRNPPAEPAPSRGRPQAFAAAIACMGCFVFATLFWQSRPAGVADVNLSVGQLVVLEPEDWAGKPFPISDNVDVDLTEGEWIVLLHRHDCPDCQAAVPQYETLASSTGNKRVALIEIPPYAEARHAAHSPCLVGRLSADHEWFVQTPVEITLRDGVVVAVSRDLPAVTESHMQDEKSASVHTRYIGTVTQSEHL